jgi:phage replication O-like protein O
MAIVALPGKQTICKETIMNGPQCEDGYTKIANELLQELCKVRIPGEAMQIFLVILRHTYGYNKKEDRIALSQFTEETGIVRTHVQRAIDKLVKVNIVTLKGNCVGVYYGINKHFSTWLPLPKKVTLPKKVQDVTQKGKICYPKRGIQKKERKKERDGELFELCKAWKGYAEMRKTIKKPMTEYAAELRIKALMKLQAQGEDPIAVLNQSIANCWQDIYAVKTDKTAKSSGDPIYAR